MKIEASDKAEVPPKRGRRGHDYSLLDSAPVVKITGSNYEKIRMKTTNFCTGAKARGYKVRSHVIKKDGIFIGCIVREDSR